MSDLYDRLQVLAEALSKRLTVPPDAPALVRDAARFVLAASSAEERAADAIKARDEAIRLMSDYARRLGEMEGRYKAAHWPGIVDGWQERAQAAEAQLTQAREALVDLEREAHATRDTANGNTWMHGKAVGLLEAVGRIEHAIGKSSTAKSADQLGWCPDREAIAREAALHGLGRIDGMGNREPPNEKWTQGEWERRILECVPGAVELQCYALADAILALPAPAGESRPCTCHPDDKPPTPCAGKFALSECRGQAEESSGQSDLERYAALGRACEGNGLGWYEPNGEMRFQAPADLIAEQAAEAALRESAGQLGWRPMSELPAPERRIILLYADGSGAGVYFHAEGGLLYDGEDGCSYSWESRTQFSHWAYLPRGYRLWGENNSDDPLSLPPDPLLATPTEARSEKPEAGHG